MTKVDTQASHLPPQSGALNDVKCLLPVLDEGVEGRSGIHILKGGRGGTAPAQRHPQWGVSQPAGHPAINTGGRRLVWCYVMCECVEDVSLMPCPRQTSTTSVQLRSHFATLSGVGFSGSNFCYIHSYFLHFALTFCKTEMTPIY